MKKYDKITLIAQRLRAGLLCVCFLVAVQVLGGCGAPGEELSGLRKEAESQDKESTSEGGDSAPAGKGSDAGENGTQGSAASGVEKEADVIYVHVCGAVKNPGVYGLPAGSRCYEAVEAAGGFAEDACEDYLNMAALLSDGSRLEIPTIKEAQAMEESGQAAGKTEESDGKVNINTADVDELCKLPGVGEGRAKAIIEYREKQGRFQKKEDIMQVSGIGEKMYARMEEYLKIE